MSPRASLLTERSVSNGPVEASCLSFRPRGCSSPGVAGFVGANFVHLTLRTRPDVDITVLDALTYAGTRASLDPVADRITFVHGDICDSDFRAGLTATIDWYRTNGHWWRPQKDTTEAVYVGTERVITVR
ncbi:NAD-dependent epimerase/dehydratase family protein [Rhodococcus corynebacterioides]|uniref:NAD-dependent epimerase/dehydratase family protein n=1 Tax=Rhodococcoides corynebacterioides TaxID=53972 RepID=A0ABS7P8L4_9NOCA|nr:NAD-dependent epimerase/dehydratase family protein [Rhodococcus corynebacterioides]MBY6409687.1 NAD-dependent epimerase/dehydratase family protein [Rhodococcus corynebacterioides]